MNRIVDVFAQSTLKTAKILDSLTLIMKIANALVIGMPISANQHQKLQNLMKLHVLVFVP